MRAMAAVPDHDPPTGALQRHHSLNCDIEGLAKCPPESRSLYIGQWRYCVWIVL